MMFLLNDVFVVDFRLKICYNVQTHYFLNKNKMKKLHFFTVATTILTVALFLGVTSVSADLTAMPNIVNSDGGLEENPFLSSPTKTSPTPVVENTNSLTPTNSEITANNSKPEEKEVLHGSAPVLPVVTPAVTTIPTNSEIDNLITKTVDNKITGVLEFAENIKSSGKGVNSYFLNTGNPKKILIQTTRYLNHYLGKTMAIEINSTIENFKLTDIYLVQNPNKEIFHGAALVGTGPATWVLFAVVLILSTLYWQKRKMKI
jgi:hypothetical protein